MGTHGYLNTRGYPHSGYPRGYGAGTGIIFIKRDGEGYHTICTHGYPLTSLVMEADVATVAGLVIFSARCAFALVTLLQCVIIDSIRNIKPLFLLISKCTKAILKVFPLKVIVLLMVLQTDGCALQTSLGLPLPFNLMPCSPILHHFLAQLGFLTWVPPFHVINNSQSIQQCVPFEGPDQIFIGNGQDLKIHSYGSSRFNSPSQSITSHFLHNLLHVPSITKNLISVSKFDKEPRI